ncbi:MAG: hypothetical protein U0836_19890 [Pirellulales bacterium]
MIKRAFLAAAICACLGQAARAVSDLTLLIDPDGTTYIKNTTAGAISFDGYQIASETNALDPAHWNSISDQAAANPLDVIGLLGAGALTFGEANPGAGNLAELNLGGAATLQGGATFAIGKPFGFGGFEVEFWAKRFGGGSTEGDIVIVPPLTGPEPSTFVLAALAGACLVAIRVRSSRAR